MLLALHEVSLTTSPRVFQWAPTLGGECYITGDPDARTILYAFQWAPTLGGECYSSIADATTRYGTCFNGHPPLGVNATKIEDLPNECAVLVSMGTHPWG